MIDSSVYEFKGEIVVVFVYLHCGGDAEEVVCPQTQK